MMQITKEVDVARRQVFYLSGFDPRGAAFYHRLFHEESSKQASLLNAEIKVGARARIDVHCNHWPIDAVWNRTQDTTKSVHTDYFFLNWDDIVRQHWQSNVFKLVLESIAGYFGYIKCGAFSQIQQHYRGPFFSALYPFLYLIVLLMLSILFAVISSSALAIIVRPEVAMTCAFAAFGVSLFYGLRLANRWGVFWLLRTYLFVFQIGLKNSSMMLERINHFVEIIKNIQQSNAADEVLIVGHSVGSIITVHLAALYFQKYPELASKVKLVTLGQCIPLLNGVPQAQLFNQHLAFLENQDSLAWFDFIARADSLAFCNEKKLLSSHVAQPSTHVIRFFNAFVKKRYQEIQRNKLRLHFQYLMSTEKLIDYDYFSMTIGLKELTNCSTVLKDKD